MPIPNYAFSAGPFAARSRHRAWGCRCSLAQSAVRLKDLASILALATTNTPDLQNPLFWAKARAGQWANTRANSKPRPAPQIRDSYQTKCSLLLGPSGKGPCLEGKVQNSKGVAEESVADEVGKGPAHQREILQDVTLNSVSATPHCRKRAT